VSARPSGRPQLPGPDLADAWLRRNDAELVAVRRDLHAHPELGREEHRTTALLLARLRAAGLTPQPLGAGTGLVCDVGSGGPVVVLRADIDALPLDDEKLVPYRSTVPGVCHACGHDVHTTAVLGAGLALAAAADRLGGTVRLVFQPAEELMPGGALGRPRRGLAARGDGGVRAALRPRARGRADRAEVRRHHRCRGRAAGAPDRPGGHTSRPHNTVDLVHVLSTVATGLPDALGRLVDPRAGLCLVWGHVSAGVAHNAIPRTGVLKGTLRVLDKSAWHGAPVMVQRIVDGLVAPFGAHAEVTYERGVPPVVNEPSATALMAAAVRSALGSGSAVATSQSLGGEDFAWYLDHVPGSLARLGVKPPGQERAHDLHQGSFDVDESALAIGVRVLVATAVAALSAG
jgi:amidohydrolase